MLLLAVWLQLFLTTSHNNKTMARVTKVNLKKLNTLELFKHHNALSSSINLLTDKSKQDALDELEQCAGLRSSKIDGLHYAIVKNEHLVEIGKSEKQTLDASIKRHQNEIDSIKSLIKELRRRGHATDNKLVGKDYEFTVSPIKDSIEITSDVSDWSDDEQEQCAIVKEVITTTVLKTVNGTVIDSQEKLTFNKIPNLEAIRALHNNGQKLPQGVTVKTNYAIRTHRILNNSELDRG
tara:strand:+ start:10617 stop:11327 length:711 start_codon:yes stop_codon:yes gene_type:complete